ncbi:MAG: VWA domain-containing protein [Myxococcales bacterium]|nr:VWA domain-containing protein [Myxococcales bacterium]
MQRTLFVSALLLCVACGPALRLTLVQSAYKRPSNVAVFFTVDDRNGDPVPGLQAADFRIYEDGQLVSVDEAQQTIVNPEVAAEHYTLLLVDMSGSVTASDQVPAIVEAAQNFASQLEGYQKVAVYAFDGSAEIFSIQGFRDSAGGIARLGSFRTRDPSTNLYGAVVQASEVLSRELERANAPLRFGTLVVFTDGTDRAARVSAQEMRQALDGAGYDVFAIGVGNEIDERTLDQVGRSGFVKIEDSAAIAAAFEAITQRIIGYTQRFYLLSYCSPARAGTHRVTIEAVSEGRTGRLDYEFDATGFGPNCNPSQPPPFDTRRFQAPPTRGGRIELRVSASSR